MMEKMKKSAENIKMPDDVRERIIDKCAEIEKAERNGDTAYTDHVFTVERVKPNRIRKVVSGLAACAVLAGGIGATGAMLHRNGSGNIASEVAQEACYVLPPFGDLSQYDYAFSAMDENEEWTEYEKSDELTDFLNRFNWGEEVSAPTAEEEESFSGKRYVASWNEDEYYFEVEIRDNGTVIYRKDDFNIADAARSDKMLQIFFKKYYHIDFAEFERGLSEVLYDNIQGEIEGAPEYSLPGFDFEKLNIGGDEETSHKLQEIFCGYDWAALEVQDEDIYDLSRRASHTFYATVDSAVRHLCITGDGYLYLYDIDLEEHETGNDPFEIKGEPFNIHVYKLPDTKAVDALGKIMEERPTVNDVDIDKKHTEDNAAYYLPGFNFEKLGIGGDMYSKQLQEIFYGYDWQAHEVTVDDPDSLGMPPYSFKADIGIIDGRKSERRVEVFENGYIRVYDINEKENILSETYYKFSNSDILDAIEELYGLDNEQLAEENRKRDEEQAKLAQERRLRDEAQKEQEEIEQRVREEEQKMKENLNG